MLYNLDNNELVLNFYIKVPSDKSRSQTVFREPVPFSVFGDLVNTRTLFGYKSEFRSGYESGQVRETASDLESNSVWSVVRIFKTVWISNF